MRVAIACLLLTTSVVPAMAEDSPIAGTWINSVSTGGPDAPEPWGSVKQVYQITVGEHVIVLGETPIAEIATTLGGASHRWGEAGDSVIWACFARNAETLWIYSDGEMGHGTVTGVGVDVRDPAPASAQCAAWPAAVAVDLGIMGIGLPMDAIIGNYGTSQPDDYGWMRSANLTPDPTNAQSHIFQELTFREADGVINAVAVLQDLGD